jgi:GT2 family glycosyltransferase
MSQRTPSLSEAVLSFIKLPPAPPLEAFDTYIPKITPLPKDVSRPFWSVMIPTYNSGDFLRKALESVLCQDLGPDQMQIEVVDGGSTSDNPEKIAEELGHGRVEFYRLAKNRGAAATWNACIERARGQWVHLLHGDDMVLPGFYKAYARVIGAYPQARTVVGQACSIDEHDRWIRVEGPEPPSGGGLLEDFVDRVATQWLVTCPSVVVNRAAYENIGGYSNYFRGPLDWDMFLRLGLHSPVACVERPFSLYRRHSDSNSQQLLLNGVNVTETCVVVAINLARIEKAGRTRPADTDYWRARNAGFADSHAWQLSARGNMLGRYHQARGAWILKPTAARLKMLIKSWVRLKLAHGVAARQAQQHRQVQT